jgi:hypothetical protein
VRLELRPVHVSDPPPQVEKQHLGYPCQGLYPNPRTQTLATDSGGVPLDRSLFFGELGFHSQVGLSKPSWLFNVSCEALFWLLRQMCNGV